MAELYPLSLTHLLRRICYEYKKTKSIFDLPETKFYKGMEGKDISVEFHHRKAATALGPAAGPNTQLAQNIILSWLGGQRIMELKTVQIDDRLNIPRPCIDAQNIGFNIEFSQELKIENSLREYVKAWMIIHILKEERLFGPDENNLYETIFDLSVGYNLAGIQSPPVTNFIRNMMEAENVIDSLRPEIPEEYKKYRDYDFPTSISHSLTLSTFHGCPKDEIEKIVDYLLKEIGLHCIVKLNPTQLPKEELEDILNKKLGYDLQANPHAFENGITSKEAIGFLYRLQKTGNERGLTVGAKLTNTLEIVNKKGIFKDEIMYMSGQPLFVLAIRLAQNIREKTGRNLPFSFSAGIDKSNFYKAMAMNLTPITVCTDLLRPGGYGRAKGYLEGLGKQMDKLQVRQVLDFIIHYGGHASEAIEKTKDDFSKDPLYEKNKDRINELFSSVEKKSPLLETARNLSQGMPENEKKWIKELGVRISEWAGVLNTPEIVAESLEDPRYHASKNAKVPKRIGTKLFLFDCISCDKCVPVCPNDSNFIYSLTPQTIHYKNLSLTEDGFEEKEGGTIKIEKDHQLANYADFCNECSNCDTFCPEYGGPFIEKPSWFSSLETWKRHQAVDGFFVDIKEAQEILHGRIKGKEYKLLVGKFLGRETFCTEIAEVEFLRDPHKVFSVIRKENAKTGEDIDLNPYYTMRVLLDGILKTDKIHYVNTRFLPSKV